MKNPLVIGVTGGSASGKTSVCHKVIQALNVRWVVLLSMDSFYRPIGKGVDPGAYNFDHPNAFDYDLMVKTISDLRQGKRVHIPIYCFKTHSRLTRQDTVYGADVIILEGILTLYSKELRDLMDIKLFVDTDDDVRLCRRYIIVPRGSDNLVAIELLTEHIRLKLRERGYTPEQPALNIDASNLPKNIQILKETNQVKALHSMLRNRNTSVGDFVFYSDRLTMLIIEEALTLLPYREKIITTPVGEEYVGSTVDCNFCAVSVLRAGSCMEQPLRSICKGVRTGKILIQSDENKQPQLFYERLPDLTDTHVLVLDPTIASGASSQMAIRVLLDHGVPEDKIIFVSVIASIKGVLSLNYCFPDLKIVTSALDNDLSDQGYIMPELDGDNIKIWVQDPTVSKSLQFAPHRFDLGDHIGVDSLINSVDTGRWVGVMIIGNLVPTDILSRAFGKLGGCKIANYGSNINYCLIGHKGSPSGTAQEDYGDYRNGQTVTVTGALTQSLSLGTKSILFLSDNDAVTFGLYNYGRVESRGIKLKDGINVITFGKEIFARASPVASLQTFHTDIPQGSTDFINYITNLDHSSMVMIIAKWSSLSSLSSDDLTAIQKCFRSQMVLQFSKQHEADSTWMMVSRKDKFMPIIIVEPINELDDRTDPLTPTNGVGDIQISMGTCNPITSGPHQEYGFLYTYVNGIPIIYTNSISNAFFMTVINEVTGDIVVICSSSPSFQTMPIDLSFAFSTLGAQQSYDITSSSSYAIIGRKGSSPGSVPERINNNGAVSLYSNFGKPMKILKPFIDIQSHSKPTASVGKEELDDMSKFSINGVTIGNAQCLAGLNVLIINPNNGIPQQYYNYDTTKSTTASNDFIKMLQEQAVGTIVAINTCGNASNYLSNEAKTKIVDILGGSAIKSFNSNQSYSIIGSVIDPTSPLDSKMVSESMSPAKNPSSSLCRLPIRNLYHNIRGYTFSLSSFALATFCLVMINGDSGTFASGLGLNVAIIDPDLPFPSNVQRFMFNTYDDPSQWSTFYSFILSLNSGVHLLMAVNKSWGQLTDQTREIQTRALSLIGACKFLSVPSGGSYVVIGMRSCPPGSALEGYSDGQSQVSVSQWFPMSRLANPDTQPPNNRQGMLIVKGFESWKVLGRHANRSSLLTKDSRGALPNDDMTFSVPLLNDLFVLNNPVDILSKYKAIGNVYTSDPSFQLPPAILPITGSLQSVRQRVVKALLIGIEYKDNPAGILRENVHFQIQQHARILISSGLVLQENIRVITEDITEIDPTNDINGPSTPTIKDQVSNWLTKDLKDGDTIYFVFLGRGYLDPPGASPADTVVKEYGFCNLTWDLKYVDYFKVGDFAKLFSKVPHSVNITLLFDCDYAFELCIGGFFDKMNVNGLMADSYGKAPVITQQTEGFLPLVNEFLLSQPKTTCKDIISSFSGNPLYTGLPFLSTSSDSSMPFLGPMPFKTAKVYQYHKVTKDGSKFVYSTNNNIGNGWTLDTVEWKGLTPECTGYGVIIYQFHRVDPLDSGLLYYFGTESVNGYIKDGPAFIAFNGLSDAPGLIPISQFISQSPNRPNTTCYFYTPLKDFRQEGWVFDKIAFYTYPRPQLQEDDSTTILENTFSQHTNINE
eukprot:gene12999-15290_t